MKTIRYPNIFSTTGKFKQYKCEYYLQKKITKELTIIFHSETTILISNPVYTLI